MRTRISGASAALLSAAVVAFLIAAPADAGSAERGGVATNDAVGIALGIGDQDLMLAQAALGPLLLEYADVVGDSRWARDTGTLELDVVADGARAEALRAATRLLGLPVRLEFNEVPYSEAFLVQRASELIESVSQWAPGLTLRGISTPTRKGQLEFDVPEAELRAWSELMATTDLGVPVELFPAGPGGLEHRGDDAAPWVGGLAVDGINGGSTPALCTAGWVWRRWSDNSVGLSTADHCHALYQTYWYFYNANAYVGTVTLTARSADTALLQNGTSYAPKVFVGGTTTTDKRWVSSAQPFDSEGATVAASVRMSGLKIATVFEVGYVVAYKGEALSLNLLSAHVTTGGDSGGPWLTTWKGTGYVNAHGGHHGHYPRYGVERSAYVPVQRISSRLQASIVVGP